MPRPPDVADLFRQPLIDPPHTLSVLACRSSKAQADAGARYRNLKATMKYALAFVLLILSACGGGGAAKHADPTGHTAASQPISTGPTAGPRAKPPALSPATLSYDGPTGSGRFGRVTIVHEGRAVRTLLGQQDQDGAFEREKSPRLSPDHRFVFISQIASAELDTPQGPITQETAYCNLVDTHSGCIVARETGGFCGGKFTSEGQWDNPVYPDFDLMKAAPKADDYAKGVRKPADSPETSFVNLLVCDEINNSNAGAYRSILNDRIFKLAASQIKAVQEKLSHLKAH